MASRPAARLETTYDLEGLAGEFLADTIPAPTALHTSDVTQLEREPPASAVPTPGATVLPRLPSGTVPDVLGVTADAYVERLTDPRWAVRWDAVQELTKVRPHRGRPTSRPIERAPSPSALTGNLYDAFGVFRASLP
jgi:hypothetical protein